MVNPRRTLAGPLSRITRSAGFRWSRRRLAAAATVLLGGGIAATLAITTGTVSLPGLAQPGQQAPARPKGVVERPVQPVSELVAFNLAAIQASGLYCDLPDPEHEELGLPPRTTAER